MGDLLKRLRGYPIRVEPEGEHWYRYDGYEDPTLDYYPVKRHTPCGVWLDMGYGLPDKFVLKGSGRRWAYPDKADALESFIIRKLRQVEHNENFRKLAMTALKAIDGDLSEEQRKRVEYFLSSRKTWPHNFKDWWYSIGSGITPREGDDMESHARRVAEAAWAAYALDV